MTQPTPLRPKKTEHVAVLLNANARAVTEKVRHEIARFVPAEDVYYSRTLTDAKAIASTVVSRGYSTVLTGGGDGTFVGFANEIRRAYQAADRDGQRTNAVIGSGALQLAAQPVTMPRFGVLHLGTGNALAGMLGASKSRVGVVEDILRAKSGDIARTRRVRLLQSEGKSGPFAGMGLDAKVLNDYNALKQVFGQTPLKPLMTGSTGYALSIAGLSIPDAIAKFGQKARVRITNEGDAAAYQVSPDGRQMGQAFEKGEVLYEGIAHVAAASTVPCYGFGFNIFPFAQKAGGRMQVRVSAMPIPKLLAQLPTIWKGRTPPGFLDFFADHVKIEFDREMPFQIGGDAEGYRKSVEIAVDPHELELLDFRPPA